MQEITLEKRLENWRRTVLGSGGRGGSGACCASWARLYVAVNIVERTEAERELERRRIGVLPALITVDELDGWLVEACVRALPDFNEKTVLRCWYVFQHSEHFIKRKLLLRRGGINLVRGRALTNLNKMLAKMQNPATILSNNFSCR